MIPKVLLVDDSPANLLTVEEVLRGLDIECVRANSGVEALRALLKDEFALVVLDVNMPGMDGFETAENIRNREKTRNLPIIFLTASDRSDRGISRGYSLGAVDYLTKPIVEPVLRAKVAVFVELYRMHREVQVQAETIHALERQEQSRRLAFSQQRAAEAERQLQAIVSNVGVTAFSLHPETLEMRYVSHGARGPWVDDRWIDSIHPEDRPMVVAELRAAREPIQIEYRAVQPDNSVRWIRIRAAAANDRIEVVGIDVTDTRMLEQQLRQAQKMEAIGRLAGGIAHDFNNLLTVMLGYSELVLAQMDPGEMRENVEAVRNASERAAGLTRQLLAFSRKQVLQPRAISLSTLLSDLERIIRRLIGEDLKVELHCEEGVPAVNMDPGQLEQIVMNLVVNARDAMPDGGTLRLRTRYEAPHSVLVVEDTGIGMDEATQSRIFEPFFTTKEEGRGTGLGLSTVYGIVQQSQGRIELESRLGHGTTFRIYLPPATETAARPSKNGSVSLPLTGGQESILVVDDDTAIRGMAERMLTRLGYQVLTAPDGKQALALLANGAQVDLVLTDVVMPEMGGADLIDHLARQHPGIKVLCTSGYTDPERFVRLGQHVAFIQKPYNVDSLQQKVRQVLAESAH